jgi:DUF1680 family protein
MSIVLVLALSAGLGSAPAVPPVIADAARPLPLSAVRLTGGPLKHAQDLDAAYLLRLDIDRMLAPYRRQAGLEPKAEGYGGWEAAGRNLTGHILGHYLSAVSLMWAATGDVRFKERADTIVNELKIVQDANKNGYLGALDGGRECFAEVARGTIRSTYFDLNGLWSPWYTLHKTYAGLRDAYRYTGNRTALELEVKYAAWAESIVSRMTHEQDQHMLNTEFGGMNEVLVDLYTDTGDRRWLELSYRFEHEAVLDPLKHHEDRLSGLHGNTQIPKLIGSLDRFAAAGDPGDGFAAGFFWDRVVHHHSYATGGHGKNEYFGEPDTLSDRVDGRTAETCNVYNMLKLTRRLFALRPDPYYAEFHERALFNHILASIDPEDGRMCYMVPVGRGVQHDYQDMAESFTCCVGTGMESHALHGDGIYYASLDRLWVNLYAPSTARWEAAGVTLLMETDFPDGESARIELTLATPRSFTLAVRRPRWAGEGFSVAVNGEGLTNLPPPQSFVEVKRAWKSGDVIEIRLPKTLHLEPVPDNPRRAAILWGPLVLAGNLGPEDNFPAWKPGAVPGLVAAERPVAEWLKPASGKPGLFRTHGVGRPADVELAPFYRLHRRTYAIYWDLYTPDEWSRKAAEYVAEIERQGKLRMASVGFVQPGDPESEEGFNQRGEESEPDRSAGRLCRRGRKWFSFDMPVDPTQTMAVVATYYHDEWRDRSFDIVIDGEKVGEQLIERGGVPHFLDVTYDIPAPLTRDKESVTVRFEATNGNEIACVYGLHMVRAEALKR